MPILVLLRHGQSAWNLENRFTGWWDVNITDQGVAEAIAAGKALDEAGIRPDEAFTSVQTRAIKTLNLALEAMGRLWIPVTKDWHLNERHYGGLTGLNKAETIEKHGEEQVKLWRRSFDVPPPPLAQGSDYDLSKDPRYAGIDIPAAESLKDTIARVLPYYQAVVEPRLKAGKTVIIAAHGNSLRALVKHLSGLSDDEIVHEEIPTGKPLVYRLDGDLGVESRAYLG
jgi:2,3-bisphosphoglycerate-dependent phosphoglycerate mutase